MLTTQSRKVEGSELEFKRYVLDLSMAELSRRTRISEDRLGSDLRPPLTSAERERVNQVLDAEARAKGILFRYLDT